MYSEEGRVGEGARLASGPNGAAEEIGPDGLRPGQDVRFLLVAVGGGAVRIARSIARRRVPHLETVAINCDPSVQAYEEFDRRLYFGPESGAEVDTGGSPHIGSILARAAEPALDKVFRGATFVVVIGSLGGGAGSGVLPHVLEVASRHAHLVSAFVVKPFRCEGERRELADRVVGKLSMVPAFVEKQGVGQGTLQVLDNEGLASTMGHLPFHRISEYWAERVGAHIESAIIGPYLAELSSCWRPTSVPETLAASIAPLVAAAPVAPAPMLPAMTVAEAELEFEPQRPLGPSPL